MTSYSYVDPLERLTNVQRGATTQSHTAYSYASAGTQVTTKQDQTTSADGAIQTETIYDLLGRPIQTVQYEASGGTITTTQSYDGLGRVASASHAGCDASRKWF